jgi:hypothetical protein
MNAECAYDETSMQAYAAPTLDVEPGFAGDEPSDSDRYATAMPVCNSNC